MCYHSNRGLAHCASPPTCQVFLLEVPFILLMYKKKASSVWFSSPQPPPHYFHASPPTCPVLLLAVPFILLIWKEIALSFHSRPPTPPPHFPSPTTHLSSLPYEKRIINQLSAISLLIWSDCWPCLLWFIYYRTSNVIRSWGRTRHFYPSKSEIYSSCVLLPVFLP